MVIEGPAAFSFTDAQHIKSLKHWFRFRFCTTAGYFHRPLLRIAQIEGQRTFSRNRDVYCDIACLSGKGKIFSALSKAYRDIFCSRIICSGRRVILFTVSGNLQSDISGLCGIENIRPFRVRTVEGHLSRHISRKRKSGNVKGRPLFRFDVHVHIIATAYPRSPAVPAFFVILFRRQQESGSRHAVIAPNRSVTFSQIEVIPGSEAHKSHIIAIGSIGIERHARFFLAATENVAHTHIDGVRSNGYRHRIGVGRRHIVPRPCGKAEVDIVRHIGSSAYILGQCIERSTGISF